MVKYMDGKIDFYMSEWQSNAGAFWNVFLIMHELLRFDLA